MARVQVQISVPVGLLKELEEYAKEKEMSRSEVIREALRIYFASRKSLLDKGEL